LTPVGFAVVEVHEAVDKHDKQAHRPRAKATNSESRKMALLLIIMIMTLPSLA